MSRDKSSQSPNKRLLPAMAVFADWASVHSCYLENAVIPEQDFTDELDGTDVSLPDIIRIENRYRSGLRSTMVHLKDKIEKFRGGGVPLRAHTLSEHAELRGFFPTKALYESVLFYSLFRKF